MGIGSLDAMNRGLLYKWRWRAISNPDSLWARVLSAIHGPDCFVNLTAKISGVWSRIVRTIKSVHSIPNMANDFIKKIIGNGQQTLFWNEAWLGPNTLASLFPRLFALEVDKECHISDRFDGRTWTWAWKRTISSSRVLAQLENLKDMLPNILLNEADDSWSWDCNNVNIFTVAQVRSHIDHMLLQDSQSSPTTWISLVPKKVNLFVWRLVRNCIPTFTNLFARGIDIETLRCLQCQHGVETIVHVFKNCYLALETRSLITRWCGLDLPSSPPKDMLSWCMALNMDRLKIERLLAILFSWWWLICKARNNRVHNATRAKSSELFSDLVATSFAWITNRRKKHRMAWLDWISNPLGFRL